MKNFVLAPQLLRKMSSKFDIVLDWLIKPLKSEN